MGVAEFRTKVGYMFTKVVLPNQMQRRSVLIAEDSPSMKALLKSLVTSWGYDPITVTNGTEALQTLSEDNAPSLAILDWMMPDMDGLEVCRRIRATGRYIYILIVTARACQQDIFEAMEAGADDYIRKPFDPQELQVRLRAGHRIMELHDALAIRATRDLLTGIPNRGAILEILEREVA